MAELQVWHKIAITAALLVAASVAVYLLVLSITSPGPNQNTTFVVASSNEANRTTITQTVITTTTGAVTSTTVTQTPSAEPTQPASVQTAAHTVVAEIAPKVSVPAITVVPTVYVPAATTETKPTTHSSPMEVDITSTSVSSESPTSTSTPSPTSISTYPTEPPVNAIPEVSITANMPPSDLLETTTVGPSVEASDPFNSQRWSK